MRDDERWTVDWGLVAVIEERYVDGPSGCRLTFSGGGQVSFPPGELSYQEALERKRNLGPTDAERREADRVERQVAIQDTFLEETVYPAVIKHYETRGRNPKGVKVHPSSMGFYGFRYPKTMKMAMPTGMVEMTLSRDVKDGEVLIEEIS